jgi:hypothetical protein
MATKAQIEANRRNALKSTGPRTPDGKHRSSLNSLIHGLCAEDASLQDDFETAAEIQDHIDEYLDYHQPADPLERDALIDAAVSRVRLNRILRAESGLLNNARDFTYATTRYKETDGRVVVVHDLNRFRPDRRRAASNKHLSEAWQHIKADLDLLSRYENRLSRRLNNAVKTFQALRRARLEAEQQQQASEPAPATAALPPTPLPAPETPRKPAAHAHSDQTLPSEPNSGLTVQPATPSSPFPDPVAAPAVPNAAADGVIRAARE